MITKFYNGRFIMKTTFIPVILFYLMINIITAQNNFDKAKLDKYFDLLDEHNKVMCSVAILQDGELVYSKAIGYASVDDKIKSSEKTKYRIGSIAKMFTASMILQLIEEGKLTLDTKLADYFPDVPNSGEITISELLYHRSGIFNITNDEKYFSYHTSAKTKKEMIEIIASYDPVFEPDTKTEYSNSNYVLLGYILENITGLSYQENLKLRITDKINLTNTYYGSKIDSNNDEAFSYGFKNGWENSFETDMSVPHGAGALVSNPEDLVKFIYALFDKKIISQESLTQMTELKENLGMGIFTFPFYDKQGFGHGGGIDHFVSNVGYFPNEQLAFSITANGMNYNINDIVIGLLSIYFKMSFELPEFAKKPITFSEDKLEKYAGYYKSDYLPLDITIKVEEGKLYGQATGQSAFPLTAFGNTEFRFEQAEIIIEFLKSGEEIDFNAFTLKQGGANYPYKRINN